MAKTAKKNKKISRKLILSIVIIAFIISAASCLTGYIQYDSTMRRLYNENGYIVGEIILDGLDHGKIAEYARTWEKDDYYPVMEEYLSSVQEVSGAAYIYIAVPDGKVEGNGVGEGTMRYIYDCTGMQIGDTDPVPKFYEEFESTYETGEKTGNYYVRHSPKYGYLTSCMLPINDENGQPVAILFVDIFMSLIVSTLVRYIVRVALISVILLLIFCIGYWMFMKRSVVRPIKIIGENAKEFAKNDIQINDITGEITTGDELQELAESIMGMEHSIVDYVENIKAITAEKERIGAELDVAAHIQASMLPCIFPAFPERDELEIYAIMDPAKEVGGDFYDFFMVDERHLAVVIADVSGKGVPAALFMVIGKTLIKDHTVPGADLGEVFGKVNDLLCQSNSEGLFITAFEGVLDLETGELDFVNAGHEMPFIYRNGEDFEYHRIKPGFVLAGMEDLSFRAGSITLGIGDKIFLYTDGVTEATNSRNELYGMDRLSSVLSKVRTGDPYEILPAVKTDIESFVGDAPQFDDITMLCLEYRKRMETVKQMITKLFPATDKALPDALAFVEEELEAMGCSMKTITQVSVCVEEMFVNVAHYAYGGAQGYVEVMLDNVGRKLSITLVDEGVEFDPLAKEDPDITLSADERSIGGLGIFMVKKSMDEVEYERKNNKNYFTMRKNI